MQDRLSWLELQRKARERSRICRETAERVFPKERFEIVRTMEMGVEDRCLVDFRDKEFTPDVDPDEYCRDACTFLAEEEGGGEEEEGDRYEECVKECKDNFRAASTSSVVFNPKTLEIIEATIAHSCVGLWMDEMEEEEEFERRKKEVKKSFAKAGCLVDPENFEHVHPHELSGVGEWELESPAICYIHPEHMDGKCRLDKLLKAL